MPDGIFECSGFAEYGTRCVSTDAAVIFPEIFFLTKQDSADHVEKNRTPFRPISSFYHREPLQVVSHSFPALWYNYF